MKHLPLLLICTLLVGCFNVSDSNQSLLSNNNAENEEPKKLKFLNQITVNDSLEIIPIGMYEQARKSYSSKDVDNDYLYANGESNSYSGQAKDLVFYNVSAGSTSLLLNDTTKVVSYIHLPGDSLMSEHHILYKMGNRNIEKGWVSNNVFYCSNINGRGLTQLSPSDADIESWKYNQNGNKLLITIVYDTNKDGYYSAGKDINDVIEVSLDNPQLGKSIFSDEFKNTLNKNFGIKQW